MTAGRELAFETLQHGFELRVLQPKFADKLATQELYLVIEGDRQRDYGDSVRKLASGD